MYNANIPLQNKTYPFQERRSVAEVHWPKHTLAVLQQMGNRKSFTDEISSCISAACTKALQMYFWPSLKLSKGPKTLLQTVWSLERLQILLDTNPPLFLFYSSAKSATFLHNFLLSLIHVSTLTRLSNMRTEHTTHQHLCRHLTHAAHTTTADIVLLESLPISKFLHSLLLKLQLDCTTAWPKFLNLCPTCFRNRCSFWDKEEQAF